MCTMIAEKTAVTGCGKGTPGWMQVNQVTVSYDHPSEMTLEHALNIDFVDASQKLGPRIAVELTPQSAQRLVELINGCARQGCGCGSCRVRVVGRNITDAPLADVWAHVRAHAVWHSRWSFSLSFSLLGMTLISHEIFRI